MFQILSALYYVVTRMKSGNNNIFLIPINKVPSVRKMWARYHICKSIMRLSPTPRRPQLHNTKNWRWQASLPLRLRFYCCNLLGRIFFSTASFDFLILNLFAHILWTISLAHLWNASNISKYLSTGLLINTHPLQFILYCWNWQIRVLQSKEMHIRTKTSWPYWFL